MAIRGNLMFLFLMREEIQKYALGAILETFA